MTSCLCTWGAHDQRCCINRKGNKYFPVSGSRKIAKPAVVISPDVTVIVKDDMTPGAIFIVDLDTIRTENLSEEGL